jgi:hypothetical protein
LAALTHASRGETTSTTRLSRMRLGRGPSESPDWR